MEPSKKRSKSFPKPSTSRQSVKRAGQAVSFTAKEVRDLTRKLNRDINLSLLSVQNGPNGEQVTCERWKLVKQANDIFGFNGWSHSITLQTVDYFREHDGLFDCGISIQVKVELKDGSFHEDLGYGHVENFTSRGEAYDKARKKAVSDGLLQALRYFGQALGNCLEEPEYIGTFLNFAENVPYPIPGVGNRNNETGASTVKTPKKSAGIAKQLVTKETQTNRVSESQPFPMMQHSAVNTVAEATATASKQLSHKETQSDKFVESQRFPAKRPYEPDLSNGPATTSSFVNNIRTGVSHSTDASKVHSFFSNVSNSPGKPVTAKSRISDLLQNHLRTPPKLPNSQMNLSFPSLSQPNTPNASVVSPNSANLERFERREKQRRAQEEFDRQYLQRLSSQMCSTPPEAHVHVKLEPRGLVLYRRPRMNAMKNFVFSHVAFLL